VAANIAYAVRPESPTWRLPTLFGDTDDDGTVELEDQRHEPSLRYEAPGPGFEPELEAEWDFDTDIARWTLPPPIGFDTSLTLPVPGLLWTRTPGPAPGEDEEPEDFVVGSPESGLAHHYWSGRVDAESVARAPFPCYDFIGPFLFDPGECVLCTMAFPTPWIGLPGRLAFPGCGPPFGDPGIALSEGLTAAEPFFATDPRDLLDVDGQWVAAAEPAPWLPDLGLRYVAVQSTGEIERVLIQTHSGLASLGSQPPPTHCDNPNGCLQSLAAAAGPRDVQVLVFSARRREVWMLRDHSVSVRQIDSGLLRSLDDPETPLGRVLAATYEPVTDRLLVVDEVSRSRRSRAVEARLLSIDPLTGGTAVLLRAPRVGLTRRFALAPDGSGGLWLAASGDSGPHVAVLLVRSGAGGVEAAGWTLGGGVLASAQARANRRGLSIAVEDRGGNGVVGHAVADLRPARSEVLRRCF